MSLRSFVGRNLHKLLSWCRAAFRRDHLEDRMDAELACHLELLTHDLTQSGFSPEEAARRARIALGPMLKHKEEMRASLGLRLLDQLWADLRYALRILRKSPGFTAVAITSLALGIGANTAIFTVAQHMLLDRLNVPHPEQLRMFYWSEPREGIVSSMWGFWDDLPGGGQVSTSFSYPVYEQLRHQNRSLADVMAFKPYGRMTVTIRGEAETAEAEMVSGNYYSMLGVQPQLGRGIQESDDGTVGSGPVVTISDRLWSNRFARSPDVIGKIILVNAIPMTIVGVNPPRFTGAYSAQGRPDIFLPFSMQPIVAPGDFDPGPGQTRSPSLLTNTRLWWVLVMGRVKLGVPAATAEASLNVALNASVRATMPVTKENQIPRLLLRDGSRGQNPAVEGLEKPVYVLMTLAGLVLLLACANLANLLLARAGARKRETSTRLALGAGRARILRQMMTESLLLSLMGGAAGLLLAFAVRNAIPRLFANSWAPPAFSARFSWPIFAFAVAVSILTGIIFGLAPAWQSTRVRVSSSLKDSGQTLMHRRSGLGGKAIVTVQVALSMLLLVGAGLFVRTLMQLGRSPLGFRSHNLLLFSVELPETRYPKAASTPLLERLEEKLTAVPGVQNVTLSRLPLISGNAEGHTFLPQGWQRKAEGNPSVLVNEVGAQFFTTYGISIIAGRGFTGNDLRGQRKVAVVNRTLANKYFPNMNPVGRTFEEGLNNPETVEIVGVCGDAKYFRVRKDVEPTYYRPYWQRDNGLHQVTFAVATGLDERALLPSLRDAMRQVDPNLPMLDVRTQDEQIAANLRQERIFAILTSGFGVLALTLACVGIYGIMAYSVVQRTSEIGVRLALGAVPRQVLGMVLHEASRMSVAGIVIGLGASLGLARFVRSMLYGVTASDPLTLSSGALILLLVALGASWIPARRAASIQPMQALRHE
ncbi:MAG TPA: ABC transporter permease [Terracidiphilus sp.]|nr:ABC transporter permease [Terracidiphilus sp.]